jgi:hypothetical protein
MDKKKFEKIESKVVRGLRVYSTPQVLKLFNFKWGAFRHWVKDGYVKPDIEAEGAGTVNYFTKENLFRIALFKKLSGFGLNRFLSSELSKEVDLEWWADINYLKEDIFLIARGEVPPIKDKEKWRDYLKVGVSLSKKIDLGEFEVTIAMNLNKIAENIDVKVD